jgi:hypothetical protein
MRVGFSWKSLFFIVNMRTIGTILTVVLLLAVALVAWPAAEVAVNYVRHPAATLASIAWLMAMIMVALFVRFDRFLRVKEPSVRRIVIGAAMLGYVWLFTLSGVTWMHPYAEHAVALGHQISLGQPYPGSTIATK